MKIPLDLLDLPENELRAAVDHDAVSERADSMRDHGQLQAIGVKKTSGGRYEVVFGATRTRAARVLLWKEIEATIAEERPGVSHNGLKLIENIQRSDLTPIEEAYGLIDLIGDGEIDVRSLQRQTGKSRDWIRNRLALADMPEDLQGAVQAGVLGVGVAKAFATIGNPIVREQYIKAAIDNGCTSEQAVVWAGQAQYAETGIMTMDQIQQTGGRIVDDTPPADMHYLCFICTQTKNWRRIQSVVICAECQHSIVDYRAGVPDAPQPGVLTTVLQDE